MVSFLRDHIPLPAVATPADAPGEPALADQVSAPDLGWLPSSSLSIEELAPIRAGQPCSTLSPDEPISVRLPMRINPAGAPVKDTFDFSATVAAREFGGHDRSLLGTIRVSDPVMVEVTGPPLPAALYRLAVTVHIYPADHTLEEPPSYQKRASGDLMRVIDVPSA